MNIAPPAQRLGEFNFQPAEGIDRDPIPRIDNDRGRFSFDYRGPFERLTGRERFERIDWYLAPLDKECLARRARSTSRQHRRGSRILTARCYLADRCDTRVDEHHFLI